MSPEDWAGVFRAGCGAVHARPDEPVSAGDLVQVLLAMAQECDRIGRNHNPPLPPGGYETMPLGKRIEPIPPHPDWSGR